MNGKKHTVKKTVNIILAVILILGILSSSFGAYAVVTANKNKTDNNTDTVTPVNNDSEAQKIEYEKFDLGGAKNEISLNENVKVLSAEQSKKIHNAMTRTEDDYYNRTRYYFDGKKDELFNDLERGDLFLINDGASDEELSVVLKVEDIYENNYTEYTDDEEIEVNEVVLITSQPKLDEAFDSIDIGFEELIKEENLVAGATVDGVELTFGNIESEFSDVSYESFGDENLTEEQKQKLEYYSSNKPEVTPLATEFSAEIPDIILKFNVDLGKTDDKKDEEESDSIMDGEVKPSLKIAGKIGLTDLAAYAVVDMPKTAQFNELFFGVRGKKTLDVYFDGKIDANFHPPETKWEFDGKIIDIKLTGLNEKMIPLGIWQFTGSSLITLTKDGMEKASLAPSIFLMFYMDAEGNFTVEAKAGFKKTIAFNSGLSVYKNGKFNFNVINYPYTTTADGTVVEPDKEEFKWYFDVSLDANAVLTLIGASVQFWIAGINIGEIELASLGFEADCHLSFSVDSQNGVKTSNDDGSTSLYLRGFFRAIGFRTKVTAEAEAFHRKASGGFEFEFRLLDLSLFTFGVEPEKYKNKIPVSTQPMPSEFATLVCLVTDVSGSMDEGMGSSDKNKIEALREAGHAITNHMESMSKQYEGAQGLSIAKFESTASTVAVPHNDYKFINECIDTLEANGGTNIAAGLDTGISQIENTQSSKKIIILMSDGQDNCSSRQEILDQAQRAKNLGIEIYTIGFGAYVDEEILKDVAEATGGEYKYSGADSIASIVSITGSFLVSYEASQGKVLIDDQGTVAQGETVLVDKFEVPDKSGDLCATLYWPGSILDIILTDPNNREVDEDYPGVTMNNSTIPSTVTITDPIPGKWKYEVKGVETSYDEEPFYAITSFKTLKRIDDNSNPKLNTMTLIGAYCLPIGVFMILVSVMLLIAVNTKKKDKKITDDGIRK